MYPTESRFHTFKTMAQRTDDNWTLQSCKLQTNTWLNTSMFPSCQEKMKNLVNEQTIRTNSLFFHVLSLGYVHIQRQTCQKNWKKMTFFI